MAKNDNGYENLLASLIVDIKSYSGKDHLLPWIRGVKKMKESLPPEILKEKLPRFLQKCAQSFESDRRYRNDSRYIRVWLQLMDFVDDPKALLRTMEANSIGTKRSLFYQAYALHYEKMKRFEEAEKMYRLGVQNLAEPMDELQKSYLQFLSRMERHKRKKTQRQEQKLSGKHQKVERTQPGSDDTPVLNFVDKAIVGKPEAENACHHGLVDPTINMKEAMNAINNMFKEPIETAPLKRRSLHGSQDKENQGYNNGFEVFVDENLQSETGKSGKAMTGTSTQASQPNQDSLEIFIDDENDDDTADENDESGKGFVFLQPRDNSPESSEEADRNSPPPRGRFREDTVVRRFVGSTISDEPAVENVCHHGLVDPTVNLKEAMEDINNMFGEPIDFVRPNRSKNRGKTVEETKPNPAAGFSILEDDDDDDDDKEADQEHQEKRQSTQIAPTKSDEHGLFEPTMCTKVALDEINKMFAMPMDF